MGIKEGICNAFNNKDITKRINYTHFTMLLENNAVHIQGIVASSVTNTIKNNYVCVHVYVSVCQCVCVCGVNGTYSLENICRTSWFILVFGVKFSIFNIWGYCILDL